MSMRINWAVRAALLAAAFVLTAGAVALAQVGSPKAFVDAIYQTYLGKDSKGIALNNDVIRRYFEPKLAAVMIRDFNDAAKRNEVPELNGDPFIDAQDWEITNLQVAVKESGADRAAATVRFQNFDKQITMTLDLVKLSADWRIADIKGPSGSLRALYKMK
jgi:hypothetical protein